MKGRRTRLPKKPLPQRGQSSGPAPTADQAMMPLMTSATVGMRIKAGRALRIFFEKEGALLDFEVAMELKIVDNNNHIISVDKINHIQGKP